jgi:hypothetical protein
MRLRMYVTLPDVASAKRLRNDLLLARVEDKRMHYLARRGTDLGDLNECTYLHKTDTVHGAFVGLVLGGLLGVVVGMMLVSLMGAQLFAVLAAALVGAVLGMWVAAMVGLQVPNSRLKAFREDLDNGKILLMLDVPAGRYEEVRAIISRTHPEAIDRGNEPTVPAFP